MAEILKLLTEASPFLILLVILAYFAKIFFEKKLEGLAGRFEEIAKTSLEIKKDLRSEERDELVKARVAIEKWEYFLQTAVIDYSMLDASRAQIGALYEQDRELFQEVRVAAVRVGVYLRDSELEQRLIGILLQIRKMYYPLISEVMPRLIDLQGRLRVIENKMAAFEKSGLQDMRFAPTESDRQENLLLQSLMTEAVGRFSSEFLGQYGAMAAQLDELKAAINQYIYRPIRETAIHKE
jgi:hypothetical protein